MNDFSQVVALTTSGTGKVCHVQFLAKLKSTKHYQPFLLLKKQFPDLAWKALQYIYLNRGRPRCRGCNNYTSWQSRGERAFSAFCSSICSNRDSVVKDRQHDPLTKIAAKQAATIERFFAEYSHLPKITCLSRTQVLEFRQLVDATPQPREFNLLKKMTLSQRKMWALLPANTARSRLLLATGQAAFTSFCVRCDKQLSLKHLGFYGWRKYCSSKCATLSTAKLRCTEESVQKARATMADRLADPAYRHKLSNRIKTGMLSRYGVENPSQVPKLHRKQVAALSKKHAYRLGDRTVHVRGYEPHALDALQSKFSSTSIRVDGDVGVPSVPYLFEGKKSIYYPDIWIPSKKILVEVKSIYTLCGSVRSWKRNCAKAKAALSTYRFILVLIGRKGRRIKLPTDWYTWSHRTVLNYLA